MQTSRIAMGMVVTNYCGRKRAWLIQSLFATSSVCMVAISAVGPPMKMNPSFSQKRPASSRPAFDPKAATALKQLWTARSRYGEVE
jgi:hypothetical protein